jgi:hypothetical protein
MNQAFAGRLIINVEPLPGELTALISPLCFSTIFLQMDNPIPVPSIS